MKEDKAIIPISKDFVSDVRRIIENGRQQAFSATSAIALATYWNIGRRIVEEEQDGNIGAESGSRLIAGLAENLTNEFGTGYNKRNLAYYRQFYLTFKDLEILHTRVQNLTWSHIRRLLSVTDTEAREWYLMRASEDMWSVKTND
ncbi:MAG: DUF1016 domain-containing protein [Bacteroides sp.]|nr:DUF1016 domain-containing protein [Bacteroides sp.]